MRSKITIDIDEANQPVIRLEASEDLSDLRDKTIKRFIENLNRGTLLSIKCTESVSLEEAVIGTGFSKYTIEPIPDERWWFNDLAKRNGLKHVIGNIYEDGIGQPFIQTHIGFQHEPDVNLEEIREHIRLHPDSILMHYPKVLPRTVVF